MDAEMFEDPEIQSMDLQTVETESCSLVERATALVVSDEPSRAHAESVYDALGAHERAIVALFEPLRAERYRRYQRVTDLKAERLAPLKPARETLRAKIKAYLAERERIRLEAEMAAHRERVRLEREAREAAEAEQRRLQAEADEQSLQLALEAEAAGDNEAATAILEQPVAPVMVPVEPVIVQPAIPVAPPPAVDRRKFGRKWKATVTDTRAACGAIFRGELSPDVVSFSQAALNKIATVKGPLGGEIPGISFKEE